MLGQHFIAKEKEEYQSMSLDDRLIVLAMHGGELPWDEESEELVAETIEVKDLTPEISVKGKAPDNVVLTPPKGLKFLKATEVVDAWGLNMVLFGVPGVGKTTLAAEAQDSPYGKDVFFIDVEGGTRSISDRPDITVWRPESWFQVKEVFDWLATESHPYRTIVIDTLNELQSLGMKDIMETAKDPEWPGIQDWGKSTEQMARLVRAFLAFSQERGWNVIFTAHANEQKDEVTGKLLIRPNLTPKATERVCGLVDVVGYYSRDRDGNRELLLEPTPSIVAKYRQPLTGPQLPVKMINPSMVDILSHLREKNVLGGE